VRLLQGNAEALPERALVALPAHPQDLHGPSGGLVQPFEDLHRGRLAGPVRSQEAEALSAAHFQVEPIHGNQLAVLLHQLFAAQRSGHDDLRLGRATSMRTGLSLSSLPFAAT
jgi:hypothetical protein